MSHRLARAAAALACLTAVTLSGCVSQDMAHDLASSRTHGVNVDVSNGTKVRNLVIVADADGAGTLQGQLTSPRETRLTKVEGTAPVVGGDPAPLKVSGGTADVKPGTATKLDESGTTLSGGLRPGLTADLTLTFADGATTTLQVPVVSAEHPDYTTPTQG